MKIRTISPAFVGDPVPLRRSQPIPMPAWPDDWLEGLTHPDVMIEDAHPATKLLPPYAAGELRIGSSNIVEWGEPDESWSVPIP